MPGAEGQPQTLYDKVLQAHVVDEKLDGTVLLYIGWFPSMTHEIKDSRF
jgi:homoaconitase/3-isopropylmalate dehydratase large subunit